MFDLKDICRFYALRSLVGFIGFFAANMVSGQAQTNVIDGELLRDPTMPFSAISAVSSGSSTLSLGGLLGGSGNDTARTTFNVSFVRSGGTSPVAVINNRAVAIGDEVNGASVIAINEGSVTLSIGGQEQVFRTFARPVRQDISMEQ